MNLASYLARYPNIRLACQADNERLLAFYSKIRMQGGLFEVRFDKTPDYFRYLSYESAHTAVCISESDAGEIEGTFSFSARPCYLAGKVGSLVYVSDLRFSPRHRRKGRFDWRSFGFDLCGDIHTIDEFNGATHLLGAIIAANAPARKAISSGNAPFENRTIDSYRMVNLLVRKPFRRRRGRKAGIEVTSGQESDRLALSAFLDSQNRERTFGYVYHGDSDELTRRLRSWNGFSMQSFLLARDRAGAIVGCLAPWDLSSGRRVILTNWHRGLAFVSRMLSPVFPRLPRPEAPLEILYVTSFEVASSLSPPTRRNIVHALLEALHDRGDAKRSHMVSICDYDADSFLPQLRAKYFLMQTPTVLVHLCRPDAPAIPTDRTPPGHLGHELCLS